ncbi:hypothetical protein, partial [Escherichia coli]|uniref:hypothetical protein n=1 Tax=Escherichia coli TaxID=562 RepID=UPI001BC8A8B5
KFVSRSVPILSLVFSMGVTTILTEGESNGLVLHPCLDMLTDKNWKPEEEIPGPLQEFGI